MLRTYNSDSNLDAVIGDNNFIDIFDSHRSDSRIFTTIYEKSQIICQKTFKDFTTDCLKVLSCLKSSHISNGSAIAVLADNSYETMVSYTAILLHHCTIVPINPSESKDFVKKIYLLSLSQVMLTRETLDIKEIKQITFNQLLTSQSQEKIKLTKLSNDHKACMFFTSGTTGNPKGVILSLANLIVNSIATIKEHDLTKDSIHFSCLPLCHVNAFSFSYFTNYYLGSRFIYQTYFFPLSFWSIIQKEKVEIVSSTPHIINLLNLDIRPFEKDKFSALKYFVSASAPLAKNDIMEFKKRFGLRINQAYGLSETVNFTLTIPKDLDDETYDKVMIESDIPSAGSPIYGNNVDIIASDGEVLEEGEVGEICIRGWNVFQEYFANKDETKKSFRGDYFHSGDTGYYKNISGRKFIFINGRMKEIVKRKGLLCYLSEIDLELKKFFKEVPFCTCGFKNKYTGEEIGIIIEPDFIINYEELKTIIAVFPPHKRVKVIVRSPLVKTSTNKPMRSKMSSLFDDYKDLRIKDTDFIFNS